MTRRIPVVSEEQCLNGVVLDNPHKADVCLVWGSYHWHYCTKHAKAVQRKVTYRTARATPIANCPLLREK